MDWRRKRQIRNLVDGILELNTLHRPPIELISAIMKQRGIIFEERDEDDEEFCGVYMVVKQAKIIFVNTNLRTSRKHFTIAHELGHHYLGHPLHNGAIICDSDSVFGKNKPEQEKEADYFAACFLMPENMVKQKRTEFFNYCPKQTTLFLEDQQLEQQHQLQRYLSDYFQVSMEAMGYRLDELKLV